MQPANKKRSVETVDCIQIRRFYPHIDDLELYYALVNFYDGSFQFGTSADSPLLLLLSVTMRETKNKNDMRLPNRRTIIAFPPSILSL